MQHILGAYTTPCIASAITTPVISGIQILNLSAALVSNYSASYSEALNFNGGDVTASNLDFCNVTITYTHPGQNDTINSETWLPVDNFNGRMLGVGGGGWVAGRFILSYVSMTAGISQGYAVTSTDAGIPTNPSATPASWGLSSPGHVNMNLLEDLGSVSLNETAYMAKALVNDFYGHPPTYSYFSGCSQGGRQGMMLAQRYPEAYDGIAASAPAINWNEMATTGYWGQVLMQQSGHFPAPCEIQAITDALIEQCDPVDGVIDGIVTDIEACNFDLLQMVGRSFFCSSNDRNMSISQETVDLVNSTWFGLTDNNGKPIWSGPHMTANLTGTITSPLNTVCSDTDHTCTGAPISLLADWLKVFVLKDKNANISHLSQEDLVSMYHSSVQQYDSVLGTRDANLSAFKARGGKLISYHGLVGFARFSLGTSHTNYSLRQTRLFQHMEAEIITIGSQA